MSDTQQLESVDSTVHESSPETWGESQFKTLSRKQRLYLAAYSIAGTLIGATKATGISRMNHSVWMTDPVYKRAWEYAEEEAVEYAEAAVRLRAVEGVTHPVYYQGELCGGYQVYSDQLALRWLEMKRPTKWKQRIENTMRLDPNNMSDEDLAALQEFYLSRAPEPIEAKAEVRRLAGDVVEVTGEVVDSKAAEDENQGL